MKLNLCLFFSFFMLFVSQAVNAQYSNYYVGIQGGTADLDFGYKLPLIDVDPETGDIIDAFLVDVPLEQDMNSIGLLVGYKFSDNIQAEFSYHDFGKTDEVFITNSLGVFSAELEYSALTINLVGSYPISRRWDVHGKIGLSQDRTKSKISIPDFSVPIIKENGDGLLFAVGVVFNINRSFNISLDYHKIDLGSKKNGFQYSASGEVSGSLLSFRYKY